MTSTFDVGIVGGGVIGLAAARACALAGYSVVLLEKGVSFLTGASGGNSGIMCTGFDAPHDSLEFSLIRTGVPLLLEHVRRCGLPHRPCGSLVLAHSEGEIEQLKHIVKENHDIGDTDVRLLTRAETLALEPNLTHTVQGSVFIPGEVVVDPFSIPASYLFEARQAGAACLSSCEVLGLTLTSPTPASDSSTPVTVAAPYWHIRTNLGSYSARVVLNAAGNFADDVEALMARGLGRVHTPAFTITPRMGQYLVLDPSGSSKDRATNPIITRPLQPLPTPITKGVFVYTSLSGFVIVGPTSTPTHSKLSPCPDPIVAEQLLAHAVKLIPTLATAAVVGAWVGLRPATEHRDYQISSDPTVNWVTCAGIRSTGLTASLGIAQHLLQHHIQPLLGPAPGPNAALDSSTSPHPSTARAGRTHAGVISFRASGLAGPSPHPLQVVLSRAGASGVVQEAVLPVPHPIARLNWRSKL